MNDIFDLKFRIHMHKLALAHVRERGACALACCSMPCSTHSEAGQPEAAVRTGMPAMCVDVGFACAASTSVATAGPGCCGDARADESKCASALHPECAPGPPEVSVPRRGLLGTPFGGGAWGKSANPLIITTSKKGLET